MNQSPPVARRFPSQTPHELLDLTVKALLDKIENGTASAADLGVARRLLKDNHVTLKTEHARRRKAEPTMAISRQLDRERGRQ